MWASAIAYTGGLLYLSGAIPAEGNPNAWVEVPTSGTSILDITGPDRPDTRWAAARLHHAAAPPRERLLRLPLWLLGYNARPGPPLAAWLITSSLIAAIHLLLTHPAPAILPTVLSTPLLPLATVGRVGTDSGILPALTGPSRLLATIAVAAPLASALIALRRLLRTPISTHPQ